MKSIVSPQLYRHFLSLKAFAFIAFFVIPFLIPVSSVSANAPGLYRAHFLHINPTLSEGDTKLSLSVDGFLSATVTDCIPDPSFQATYHINPQPLLESLQLLTFGPRDIPYTVTDPGEQGDCTRDIEGRQARFAGSISNIDISNLANNVNHTITLKVCGMDDHCSEDSIVIRPNRCTVTVNPTADTYNITSGQSVNFTGAFTTTGACTGSPSYLWTFQNGSPSSSLLQNPNNIAFSSTGTKTVSFTGTQNNSTQTKTISINVVSSPAVNGACGSNANIYACAASNWPNSTNSGFCSSGTLNISTPGFPNSGGAIYWTCLGQNGGTTASCQASRLTCSSLDGSCGSNAQTYGSTTTAWPATTPTAFCAIGTAPASNPTFPNAGSNTSWTCTGESGGSNATCNAARDSAAAAAVSGECGTNATSYTSSTTAWPSMNSTAFCAAGSAPTSNPAFPASGTTTSWTCTGQNGGSNSTCMAARDNAGCTAYTLPGRVSIASLTYNSSLKNVQASTSYTSEWVRNTNCTSLYVNTDLKYEIVGKPIISGPTVVTKGVNIGHSATLSTTTLTPGVYTLKVTLNSGNTTTTAQQTFTVIGDSVAPTQDSLTLSSLTWVPNGTNTYTMTMKATDSGSYVENMKALVNYQGSNAGNYRGYVGWGRSDYNWSTGESADRIACTGGGYADKYNGTENSGYGKSYLTLTGCSTSVSGNQRTVILTLKPLSNFGDFGAINDVSMWVKDSSNNISNWINYDLNFLSDATAPTNVSAAIAPSPISITGTSNFTLTVKSSDAVSGLSGLSSQMTAVIFQDTHWNNARGYFVWDAVTASQGTDVVSCSGGGQASKYGKQYGAEHVSLTACSTSISGTERTVTFTITPSLTFGTLTGLDVALSSRDMLGNSSSWNDFLLNVDSSISPPTVTVIRTSVDPIGVTDPNVWIQQATASINCAPAVGTTCDTASYKLKIYTDNPGTCPTTYASYDQTNPLPVITPLWICGTAKNNLGTAGYSPTPTQFKVDNIPPVISTSIHLDDILPPSGEYYTEHNLSINPNLFVDAQSGISSAYIIYGNGYNEPLSTLTYDGVVGIKSCGANSTTHCKKSLTLNQNNTVIFDSTNSYAIAALDLANNLAFADRRYTFTLLDPVIENVDVITQENSSTEVQLKITGKNLGNSGTLFFYTDGTLKTPSISSYTYTSTDGLSATVTVTKNEMVQYIKIQRENKEEFESELYFFRFSDSSAGSLKMTPAYMTANPGDVVTFIVSNSTQNGNETYTWSFDSALSVTVPNQTNKLTLQIKNTANGQYSIQVTSSKQKTPVTAQLYVTNIQQTDTSQYWYVYDLPGSSIINMEASNTLLEPLIHGAVSSVTLPDIYAGEDPLTQVRIFVDASEDFSGTVSFGSVLFADKNNQQSGVYHFGDTYTFPDDSSVLSLAPTITRAEGTLYRVSIHFFGSNGENVAAQSFSLGQDIKPSTESKITYITTGSCFQIGTIIKNKNNVPEALVLGNCPKTSSNPGPIGLASGETNEQKLIQYLQYIP